MIFDTTVSYVGDEKGIIEGECVKMFKDEYFVISRTFDGARFYSQPLRFDEIDDVKYDYIAVVDYFGGGFVEVCVASKNDYEIIEKFYIAS